MSTSTVSVSSRRTNAPVWAATFAGNLKSEWIKLTTVRSTVWSLVILAAATLGLAALRAAFDGSAREEGAPVQSFAETSDLVVIFGLGSVALTCVVVAVLGALFSAGEYGNSSIRSTMTATPRRLPVLGAKMVVLGLTTFAFAFILFLGSVAMTAALYAACGHQFVSVGDPIVLSAILGAAGYLAFTAIFSIAIGFIVRSVAATISIVVGVFFVLPVVIAALSLALPWLGRVLPYLFSGSGSTMTEFQAEGLSQPTLLPWQATLVVTAWTVVAAGAAALVLKRKDV